MKTTNALKFEWNYLFIKMKYPTFIHLAINTFPCSKWKFQLKRNKKLFFLNLIHAYTNCLPVTMQIPLFAGRSVWMFKKKKSIVDRHFLWNWLDFFLSLLSAYVPLSSKTGNQTLQKKKGQLVCWLCMFTDSPLIKDIILHT